MLSEDECARRLREVTGQDLPWDAVYLGPITNRDFLTRLLRNLKGAYSRRQEPLRALTVLNLLVALPPAVAQERRDRGLIHYQLGNHQAALEDLRIYLAASPPGVDTSDVRRLVDRIGGDLDG